MRNTLRQRCLEEVLMSTHPASILARGVGFVIATLFPIHLGAIALVAPFVIPSVLLVRARSLGAVPNNVVAEGQLPGSPAFLFFGSLVFNVLLNIVMFFLFGGRQLLGRVVEAPAAVEVGARPEGPGAAKATTTGATGAAFTDGERQPVTSLDLNRSLTLVALLGLAVGALVFQLDVGLLAVTAAVLLSLVAPNSYKGAVAQVAWPTVL